MNFTSHLPFPPKELSPNGQHGHWAKRASAMKRYRRDCAWALTADGLRKVDADKLGVVITFYPPNANRRDKANCISAFKSGLDAIADVTGIDDSKFDDSYPPLGGPIRPNGHVRVDLTW
jgi:crossover junction endodeoxyribonuclease RusA